MSLSAGKDLLLLLIINEKIIRDKSKARFLSEGRISGMKPHKMLSAHDG